MDCSAAFIGSPLKFNELITVYPPKVRDVIEEPKFNLYKSILTTTQEDIEDMITGAINGEFRELAPDETIPTPYAFLIANAHANKEYEERLKSAFYFFTHSNLTILAE